MEQVAEDVASDASDVAGAVEVAAQDAQQQAAEGAADVASDAADVAASVQTAAQDAREQAAEGAADVASDATDVAAALQTAAQDAREQATEAALGAASDAADVAASVQSAVQDAGQQAVEAALGAASDMASDAADVAGSVQAAAEAVEQQAASAAAAAAAPPPPPSPPPADSVPLPATAEARDAEIAATQKLLVGMLASLDRGAAATEDQAQRVDELACRLERLGGAVALSWEAPGEWHAAWSGVRVSGTWEHCGGERVEEPHLSQQSLRSFAQLQLPSLTARAVCPPACYCAAAGGKPTMALLDGRWRLLYSSGFASGSLGGRRPGPSFGSGPFMLGQGEGRTGGRQQWEAGAGRAGTAVPWAEQLPGRGMHVHDHPLALLPPLLQSTKTSPPTARSWTMWWTCSCATAWPPCPCQVSRRLVPGSSM